LHFSFISNFAYPLNSERKTKFDFYAFNYTYPYFIQDWRLFTPCPDNNFTIYAKYKVNNQTHYALPLQEALYNRNLFSGKEFIVFSLTGSAEYVAGDVEGNKTGITPFVINPNYFIFRHAVINYLSHKHHQQITDLKLILLLTDIKTKQKKYLVES
jgi:hypothetical protein